MQTGDITKQWMQENYGKFNRGVGESRNPVFYFIYNNYFNSNVCDVSIKVIGFILFWWYL